MQYSFAAVVGGTSKSDPGWAAAVGVIALGFFMLTLRPDVGGPEDSPKFQFVGHVLGTAHAPGYPLYTLLTSLFGKLPVGNLAYRINLFSALMGALACAGAFILSRQLGASRVAALAAVLALATGGAFWHNAIVAEVYTLAALLVVAVASRLVAWARSRHRRTFYSACGWFAAGVGHHLTIVGMLPAALVYGLSRDRTLLSTRVIAAALGIGLLGFSQYGYIVWRTAEHAPHLEARATNVSEVVDVLTSRHQANTRFQFTLTTLLNERLPALGGSLRQEMGIAGLLLLAVGIAFGLRDRRADVGLVLGAALGMLAIIINLYGDIPGFITPVIILLWPIAALGLDALGRPLGRRATPALAAIAIALSASHVIANRPEIEEYRAVDDVQAHRALYPQLPAGAAMIVEDFWTENVLNYFHFSGEYSPDPAPRLIQRDFDTVRSLARVGTPVYAFRSSVEWMGTVGLLFKPASLRGPSIESWLRSRPAGTFVAVAGAERPLPVEWLPLDARQAIGRPRVFGTLAWTVGTSDVQIDQNDAGSTQEVAHTRSGRRMTLRANANGVSIASGTDPILMADAGLIIVTVSPDGEIDRRLRVAPNGSLTMPLEPAVFTFDREIACDTLVAGRAVDVSAIVASGGWRTTLSQSGRASVDLEFAEPLARPIQHRLLQGGGAALVESSSATRARIVLERNRVSRPVFQLVVPGDPQPLRATLADAGSTDELRICPVHPEAIVPSGMTSGTIEVGPTAHDNFGAGWHDAERAAWQTFRWSERMSTFLFSLDAPGAFEIRLLLRPASAEGAVIEATFAGQSLGACSLTTGRWTECQWIARQELTRGGINRLELRSSTAVPPRHGIDPRELAFVMQAGTMRISK